MKLRLILSAIFTTSLTFSWFSPVLADADLLTDAEVTETIIISEIQTAGEVSGTSGNEFIELFNASKETVDLLDWQLVYVNSSDNQSLLYEFTESLLFLPETFIIGKLVSSSNEFLPDVIADFEYVKGSTGLASTAGGLILVDGLEEIVDEVSWTSKSSSTKENIVTGLVGGKSLQRFYLDDEFMAKGDVSDFVVDTPSPADFLRVETPKVPPPAEDPIAPTPKIAPPAPVPALTPNPLIYINEVFPDPKSPQTDAEDEYVELYNPNNKQLDISGYLITAGSTKTYKYELPVGATIVPHGYYYVKSADSPLTLTNSGGEVTLTDNLAKPISSVVYGKAISGAAWAKGSGGWAWTTALTPGGANIIKAPVAKVSAKKASKVKKKSKSSSRKSSSKSQKKTNFTIAPPIKINEVFPDPKSPQTDAEDEFIELYNPHPVSINIADYVITAGSTRTYKYTIPTGTKIPAFGYYSISSADTSITLTNSGGKVALINNFDKEISATQYPKAKSGQSWAFVDGKWQWTATPTKSKANIMTLGSVAAGSGNESKTEVAGATVAGTDDKPLVPAPQPLPVWLLAVLGVAALCYAIYEYRFEARNFFYKRQRIRGARP